LKKEHSNLSNQVKTAKDSFLGPDILDTLQKLGEYPIVKLIYFFFSFFIFLEGFGFDSLLVEIVVRE